MTDQVPPAPKPEEEGQSVPWPRMGQRRKLPDERQSITHKFSVADHEGYITVGFYEDGTPGEVFLTMAKEGSTISGLMDTIAILISLGLQYGVPRGAMTAKLSGMRFEPAGFTGNAQLPVAKSIVDYIFRWLALKFPEQAATEEATRAEVMDAVFGGAKPPSELSPAPAAPPSGGRDDTQLGDGPPCDGCGQKMFRRGTGYKCLNCGETQGMS